VGEARAWLFEGRADQVLYSTVFNQSLLSDLLALEPGGRMSFLRAKGIRYILINWREIERFRNTYGFDPRITPDAVQALATSAGLTGIPLDEPGILLLRVPD